MPVDLVMTILDRRNAAKAGLDEDLLELRFNTAGKVMVLATQMIWIVGNIPELLDISVTFAATLSTPAPLLECYNIIAEAPRTLTFDFPRSLEKWVNAQEHDPTCVDNILPEEVMQREELQLHVSTEYEPRIIVPVTFREPLIKQHHEDMFHLGADKISLSLRKSYF